VFLGLVKCPIALFTRHPCPGCGLTRATIAAMHGDFVGSFHHHPLALIMAPLLAWFLVRNAYGYVARGKWGEVDEKRGKLLDVLLIIVAFAMIAVWLARFFGAFGGPEPV